MWGGALAGKPATPMGKDCGAAEKDEPAEGRPEGEIWVDLTLLQFEMNPIATQRTPVSRGSPPDGFSG